MAKQDDGKLRCPRCSERFYNDQLVYCDEENTGSYIWLCFKCFKVFKPRGRSEELKGAITMTTEERKQLLNLRMTIDHLALCVQQFQLANQNVKEAVGQVTAAALYAEWGATDKAAEATADFDWRWEEQQQAAINLHEARQHLADHLTAFIPLLRRCDLHSVAEIAKTLT